MGVTPHQKISFYQFIKILLQNYTLHLHQMLRWLTSSHRFLDLGHIIDPLTTSLWSFQNCPYRNTVAPSLKIFVFSLNFETSSDLESLLLILNLVLLWSFSKEPMLRSRWSNTPWNSFSSMTFVFRMLTLSKSNLNCCWDSSHEYPFSAYLPKICH